MLAAAGFRVSVGDAIWDLPNVVHLPGANLFEVAERIIEQPWS